MNAIPLINNAPRPNINVGSVGSPTFNPVAAGAKLGGSIGGNVMRQNPASMPVNNETQLRQEVNTSIVALKREAFSLENLIAQAAQTLQDINKRLSELEGKQGDYVKKADATVASVGGDGKYISAISETDGKISATATDLGNMVPVNSVTSGNMHSVTSGAVYESMGIVWQGTVTMASDITSVYNWCKTHHIGSRVCGFRISSAGQASSEPFGTSSVTIIYCMSSTAYGWIQGYSDNATCNMAIAYINSTVSAWQKISYGAVSSYPSASMQNEIRTQFNNTAQYNEFKGNSMASEEGAWWGYRHSNYGSGIFISRGDVVAFYLDTYGTFECKYIFRR